MNIALAVPQITSDININFELVKNMFSEAANNGAEFILFPEAVFTGLNNNDSYEHDRKLTISVNDIKINELCDLTRENKTWLCFGFLENEFGCIYDSALLINPAGEKVIHYRRINPQWRAANLSINHYAEGNNIPSIDTPLGKTSIIICGDLFDENVLSLLHEQKPRLLLFPFARCFPRSVKDEQTEWDTKEKQLYTIQVSKTTADFTLMTNYFADKSINGGGFGGAFIMDKNKNILASYPLMKKGILYYNINY